MVPWSRKSIWFYFYNWNTFKKYDIFKKNKKIKIMSRSKVMPRFVFSLWRHLWQTIIIGANFFVTPYYIEIKDSLYLGKFFVNLLKNWYKMKGALVANYLNKPCTIGFPKVCMTFQSAAHIRGLIRSATPTIGPISDTCQRPKFTSRMTSLYPDISV